MKKVAMLTLACILASNYAVASNGEWASQDDLDMATEHGYESGRRLYICRAYAHGGTHPGKVVEGSCNIGYAGREEIHSDFEVYVGQGYWENKSYLRSQSAVVGGYEYGRHLVVCAARAHGGLHPGKVVDGRCNIGYAGREEMHDRFSVLVE